MTVLLRKEIRSLLPAWILTMAATALIAFVRPNGAPVVLFLVAIGSTVLGITSFGAEFSQGTFSLLLAQPIPRNKIWWIKTITLGIALLLVAAMVWVSFICIVLRNGGDIEKIRAGDWEKSAIFTLLFFGAAFAGGLLSALTTRQMATAFWIALLFPLAVCGTAGVFTMDRSDKTINISIAAALAIYDVFAFLLARRQFLRAQDVPGAPATNISLPAWMRFGAKAHSATAAPVRHPLRVLIAKEFQLHQVTIGFAAVLVVLHVIVLFIRRAIFVPDGRQKELYDILGFWWLLWFVLPMVIAGTAIAEERRQGTLEGSLCLPARKSTQWFIKCVVCFLLAILFGGVMPWLLEIAAQFTGAPSPLFEKASLAAEEWFFLKWAVLIAAMMTLVSFYASSLTRGLLQGVGVALFIGAVFCWLTVQMTPHGYYEGDPLLLRDLLHFGLPALCALFLWLSYTNFKHLTIGRRLWLENISILLFVVIFMSGSIVFFSQLTRFLFPQNVL